jgi:hypothetical protein
MIGLFRNHYGREQNVPIVRAGNIACMRNEPVFTDYAGYIDAYLVEAHSISGLSGSPVFLANHPRVLRSPNDPEKFIHGFHGDRPALYLMGLMHGHFDIKKLNEDTVVDDERDTTEGINTGIGVVVPVEKIVETIRDHPDLANQRKEVIENEK